ncbi:MAG: hypothetical protein WD737_01715 [Gemmatimonadota bacterium]
MPEPRPSWINFVAGFAGGFVAMLGILGLMQGFDPWSTFLAALGFLIAGWAVLDYRRYKPGTPESEVDGGHTIE